MYKIICGIYKITSPNGKIYIGQSIDIYERWKSYKSLQCATQRLLYRSLKKHGIENHKFEIVEECPLEVLNDLEIHYIKYFGSFDTINALNLTPGGNSYEKSEDHKKRISEAHKRWWQNNHREKTPQEIIKMRESVKIFWDNASEEIRRQKGDYNRGRKMPEEQKQKKSKSMKEYWETADREPDSDETRKLKSEGSKKNWIENRDMIIAAQTGIQRTEEQKINYSNGAKKRWETNPYIYTDEHKKKKSEQMKGEGNPMYGRKQSEESRRKNSESQKLAHERIRQERLTMIF